MRPTARRAGFTPWTATSSWDPRPTGGIEGMSHRPGNDHRFVTIAVTDTGEGKGRVPFRPALLWS
jgi:hypothetical protein